MNIGILECGHTMPEVKSKHGDFPQMFEQLLAQNGFTYSSFDVEHMEFPSGIHDCDGWLLTGSKHGAYEDHAFIPPLENFVRDAYAQSVPVVGICFGHQLIAQALGGHVEKFRGGWALGLNEYEFDGLGTLKLNAWHQDQVTRLPQGAKPIASNDFCTNAALVYGTRAFTVQPHPEFGGEIIGDYLKLRKGTLDYPDDLMERAATRLDIPDDNATIADTIAAFFKHPREVAHGR